MNLIKFLWTKCRRMLLVAGFTALFSGVCNGCLLALINKAVNQSAPLIAALLGFASLVLLKILSGFFSQVWLIRASQQTVADIRMNLVNKILAVPLRQLEELGGSRLMVALTEDVNNITSALFGFPLLAVNLAMLLGGSIYLGWLSWRVLLVMCLFILAGASCYRLLIRSGFSSLHRAREAEDRLFGHFSALTEGMKELKLHRERRGAFVNQELQTTTSEFQEHSVTAETRFLLAHNWAHFLFYFLIGLILFLLPSLERPSPATMTGYVVTTLYLMGPLAGVMGSIAVFGRANVALQKIDELGLSLASRSSEVWTDGQDAPAREWNRLELIGVTHSYHREKEGCNFVLGPIDLAFRRGELVFLGGGNGSGKSTLAKLVTGLYLPESGEIRVDGELVDERNRDDYRQIFSAVFSDFYLFQSLIGLRNPQLDARAGEYLKLLQLDHKVTIKNGKLSTIALSQGQRKRLALLTAYLEERSFYLFDEWASDQDPFFKEIFYTQLLPELKARGKTVLVITHDDKYFHLADRFIKLDYGRIEQTNQNQFETLPAGVLGLGSLAQAL